MKVNTAKLERELNEPRTIKRALELHSVNGRFSHDKRSFEDPIIEKIIEYLNPEIENKIGVALTLFNQIAGAGYDFGYDEGREDGYEKGYDDGNDTWEEVYGGALGYNEWEGMGR